MEMFSCSSIIKKTIFPSTELSWHHCQKSINHVCQSVFLDFQFYFIYRYILMCIPQCHKYYSVVVSFEIKSVSPPISLFFFKIIFNTLGPLHFCINLRTSLSISVKKKKSAGTLTGAALHI